ncbi:DsbA family protein [Catelliglobosispora koreensis]|uniref:DsbA family protein n=1 Tax=Catelliglobosispora koreensis TaxID=129052 RepID=UPI00037DA68F|nr:DsbA family protein [Catelliglobosispora koreensis]
MLLDVYVDPSCPWSWVAAHWLTEVREVRDIEVNWRSFSLLLRDGDHAPAGMPPEIAAIALQASRQSLRLLRLFEALRHDGDTALIERLYFAWGSVSSRPARRRHQSPGSSASSPGNMRCPSG